LTNIP